MPKVKRPQVDTPAGAAKGRPDWIVVVLALVGVGVAGYLTKPFRVSKVLEVTAKALGE